MKIIRMFKSNGTARKIFTDEKYVLLYFDFGVDNSIVLSCPNKLFQQKRHGSKKSRQSEHGEHRRHRKQRHHLANVSDALTETDVAKSKLSLDVDVDKIVVENKHFRMVIIALLSFYFVQIISMLDLISIVILPYRFVFFRFSFS